MRVIKILLLTGNFLLTYCFSFGQTGAQSLDFDGIDDYVEGNNPSLPQGNSPFTIEAWINPTSTQNGTIFNWGDQSQGNRCGILYVIGRIYIVGGAGVLGTTNVPVGIWTHVAASFDGTTIKLYVNGNLDVSTAITFATNGTFFRFGCSTPPAMVEFFKGKIDEVRLWNKALSSCEIQNFKNCEYYRSQPGLISYYTFNQGFSGTANAADSILIDKSGNEMNGSLRQFSLSGTVSNWASETADVPTLCHNLKAYIYKSNEQQTCGNIIKQFFAISSRFFQGQTYQWTRNGVPIAGATDSSYSGAFNNNDKVQCIITTSNNCIKSTDISNEVIASVIQQTYKFIGNGNWNVASNWEGENIPPHNLPSCSQIVIDPLPTGECFLEDTLHLINNNLTVKAGKNFRVAGLIIRDSINAYSTYLSSDTSSRFLGALVSENENLLKYPTIEDIDTSLIYSSSSIRLYSDEPKELPMPPIKDQGKINNCVGWALSYATMSYLFRLREGNSTYIGPNDKVFSPSFVYNQLNNNQNVLISLLDAMELVKRIGSCKLRDMPNAEDFTTDPSPEIIAKAKRYKIDDYSIYTFTPFQYNVENIKSKIRAGLPVIFSANVDEAFMAGGTLANCTKIGGRIVFQRFTGQLLNGRHVMVICGYDDIIHAFKVQNSWGTGKGDGGYYWIDYDFLIGPLTFRLGYILPSACVITLKKVNLKLTTTLVNCGSDVTTAKFNASSSGTEIVIEKGFCYGDYQNPTIGFIGDENNKVEDFSGLTNNNWTATLSFLPNKQYYVRSYAITTRGIIYGNEIKVNSSPIITVAGGNGIGSALNQLPQNNYYSMAVDQAKNIYVCDQGNHRVVKWAPGATVGVVVAGGNGFGSAPNQLYAPIAICVDQAGNLYISDANNYRIQKWAPGATEGITVAGITGENAQLSGDLTRLSIASFLAIDNSGNLYIPQFRAWQNLGPVVLKWPQGATSGQIIAGGYDSEPARTYIGSMNAFCVDASGVMYISTGSKIVKWQPGAQTGSVIVGNNGAGSAPDQISLSQGITVDPQGNLYIADQSNHRIQRWAPGASSGVTVVEGCSINNPTKIGLDSEKNIYVDYFNFIKRWPKYD